MGRSRFLRRLTAAERRVWEAYPTGEPVDLRAGDRESDDPAGGDAWGPERTVRAKVLVALLLGAREREPGRAPGLRLSGAKIVGSLDLSGAQLDAKVHLLNCYLPGTVDISDSSTRSIRLRSCHVHRLRAARCRVEGLLDLDGTTVHRGVRLDNAHVVGQLRMSHTRLHPRRGESAPETRMVDAFAPYSAQEIADRGVEHDEWALWAGGLTVDGGAFLRRMHATAGVRLPGARFLGGLNMRGAVVEASRTPAVYGDNLEATHVEFSAGFTARGTVRLRGARVSGVLSFDLARLSDDVRSLHLSHMQVDELILTPESIEGEVNLSYSRVGVLLDRPGLYPDGVHLNGLVYESLRGGWKVAERIEWVSRDPGGYRPQPYEQLAAWYRRIGHEPDARRVLLARQRARRRTLRLPGRVWGRLLDGVVGYGYRPWLAAVWAAVLLATGTVVFTVLPPTQIDPDEARRFDAFVYTLDLLVPVTVFEQRGAWEPVGWTRWLANVLIVSGWILATALIAGATRVLRPSSNS